MLSGCSLTVAQLTSFKQRGSMETFSLIQIYLVSEIALERLWRKWLDCTVKCEPCGLNKIISNSRVKVCDFR